MRHQEHFRFGTPFAYWESKHESPAEERFADKGVQILKGEYAAGRAQAGNLLQTLTPLMQQALVEGMEAFITTFGKCLLKQMVRNFFG